MKKIISAVLALGILASPVSQVVLAKDVMVEKPFIFTLEGINTYKKGEFTMVPLREILEGQLDMPVLWNNEERSVEVGDGPRYTKIYIGKDSYFHQKVAHYPLGQAPEIKDDLTYVPLEFLTEVLGAEIFQGGEDILVGIDDRGFITEHGKTDDYEFIKVKTDKDDIILKIFQGDTKLMKDGKEAEFKDFKMGSLVEFKMDNKVTMSLPPQAVAFEINIVNDKVKVFGDMVNEVEYPKLFIADKSEEELNQINNNIKKAYKGLMDQVGEKFSQAYFSYFLEDIKDVSLEFVFRAIDEEGKLIKEVRELIDIR